MYDSTPSHFFKSDRLIPALALFVVLIGFAVRVLYPDTLYFNIHAERDVWRSVLILEGDRFTHYGSELTKGGYTWGPGLYLLQLPPLAITYDPRGLLVWLALLHAGGIWLTFLIGREHFSERTGLAAAALFATFPLAMLALRYLWNPSYIFPLSTLFYWSLLDWIFQRRTRRLWLVGLSVALMFQVHLSAALLLVLTGACAAIYRPPITKKSAALALGCFVLVFLPYIMGELGTGFQNTRLLFDPPTTLTTANGAIIPAKDDSRVVSLNKGAMKAFQVAVSPVFYDRRLDTGSFSYLALLGEFGPQVLPGWATRIAFLLNSLRWPLALMLVGTLGLLVWIAVSNRLIEPTSGGDENSVSPRLKSLFFPVAFAVVILPTLFSSTMITIDNDEQIGVGAVRYFFVLYPLPFIVEALFFRWAYQVAGRFSKPAQSVIVAGCVILCALQLFVCWAYLKTGSNIGRSFKYSLHETFDWGVQRDAADALIKEWGVSPDQFDHRFETLDHTFDSTRFDVPSLEQGLDFAYYTNRSLIPDAAPRYPDSSFLLYDRRRTPNADLQNWTVEARIEVGDLVLLRVADRIENEFSPIQNTWEKLYPAR